LEFGQWNTIFGDKHLTAAIIDRLVLHAQFSYLPAKVIGCTMPSLRNLALINLGNYDWQAYVQIRCHVVYFLLAKHTTHTTLTQWYFFYYTVGVPPLT
jgi:hypothetical protein